MEVRAEEEALGPKAFTETNAETKQKFAEGGKRLFLAHRGVRAQRTRPKFALEFACAGCRGDPDRSDADGWGQNFSRSRHVRRCCWELDLAGSCDSCLLVCASRQLVGNAK